MKTCRNKVAPTNLPKYSEEKMKQFVLSDNGFMYMFDEMKSKHPELANGIILKVLFDTYIADDFIMAAEYKKFKTKGKRIAKNPSGRNSGLSKTAKRWYYKLGYGAGIDSVDTLDMTPKEMDTALKQNKVRQLVDDALDDIRWEMGPVDIMKIRIDREDEERIEKDIEKGNEKQMVSNFIRGIVAGTKIGMKRVVRAAKARR